MGVNGTGTAGMICLRAADKKQPFFCCKGSECGLSGGTEFHGVQYISNVHHAKSIPIEKQKIRG